jgi:hypothetical protein
VAKARFTLIKGACFTGTMMHAGCYSVPATTTGKRMHPLAIKARGCTALKEEEIKGMREEKKRK